MSRGSRDLVARAVGWLVEPATGPPHRPTQPTAAHRPGRSVLASALARAESWLVEPAGAHASPAPVESKARPVIAVCGIAGGCGATTVARALAAELASRDALRSAVVAGPDSHGALPVGTPAAARLARLVGERSGIRTRSSGRLCLTGDEELERLDRAVRGAAPAVIEAAAGDGAGAAAALADHVILLASPSTQPALAEIVADSLARVGPAPLLVVNRTEGPAAPVVPRPAIAPGPAPSSGPGASHRSAGPPSPAAVWQGRAHASIPASPAGARLALACRGAGGAFGAAIAELADLCAQT